MIMQEKKFCLIHAVFCFLTIQLKEWMIDVNKTFFIFHLFHCLPYIIHFTFTFLSYSFSQLTTNYFFRFTSKRCRDYSEVIQLSCYQCLFLLPLWSSINLDLFILDVIIEFFYCYWRHKSSFQVHPTAQLLWQW